MNELLTPKEIKEEEKRLRQQRIRRLLAKSVAFVASILITMVYGYGIVYLFEQPVFGLEPISWSFVMLLPYAVGLLGTSARMRSRSLTLSDAIFVPWIHTFGVWLIVSVLSVGMLFCLVISIPIMLPAASLGGVTAWLLKRKPKVAAVFLALIMTSPVLLNPIEAQFEQPTTFTTTHTSIDIDADAETVWNLMTRVETIMQDEQRPNWIYLFGFPRPIAATLDYDGIGGVRVGTFENDLRFEETILEWELHKRYAFTIVEASDNLLPPPLDMIDGERFDMVGGSYEIELLADGSVRLHLTSEHFLGTRFNKYGAFWTDQVMRNLQNHILDVIRDRAESVG